MMEHNHRQPETDVLQLSGAEFWTSEPKAIFNNSAHHGSDILHSV